MMPYHEISERVAAGLTVRWFHDAEEGHLIQVFDAELTPVAVLTGLTAVEARDLFDHTFATKQVPDIFKREPEVTLTGEKVKK
jgi:hypothetical protein